MDGRPQGGGRPPYERDRLREALALEVLEPGKPLSVPFDFYLYRLARRHGLQPWVFDGEPPDRPSLLWLARVFEFARMEASARVTKSG